MPVKKMKAFKIEFNLKQLFFIGFLLLLILFLAKLKDIITLFAISILIAYLFDPIVDYMEAKRINRVVGIFIIFLIFTLFLFLIAIFLIPILYSEAISIAKNLPEYFQKILPEVENLIKKVNPSFDVNMLKDALLGKLGVISKFLLSATKSVTSSVYSVIKTLLNIFLTPILVFYFLKDFDRIKENFFNIINVKFSHLKIEEYFNEFNSIVSRYFRGQLLVCLFLAFSYTVVLLIIGIEGAVLIGVISGLLSIVPYLGFLSGFISSLLIAYFQFNDFIHPLFVVIGFSVVQFIESNIVTPKLVGGSLGLHPTAVIFALMVGGYLFGIGGMIFSLPVAAFIKVYTKNVLTENVSKTV